MNGGQHPDPGRSVRMADRTVKGISREPRQATDRRTRMAQTNGKLNRPPQREPPRAGAGNRHGGLGGCGAPQDGFAEHYVLHYQFCLVAEMKPKRKFLLIDEAWSLLRLKNTAEFITNSFKTYRKYRCSAVAITQEIVDLVDCDCGIAIQANAANKVFLKQEPNVVDSLKTFASLRIKK